LPTVFDRICNSSIIFGVLIRVYERLKIIFIAHYLIKTLIVIWKFSWRWKEKSYFEMDPILKTGLTIFEIFIFLILGIVGLHSVGDSNIPLSFVVWISWATLLITAALCIFFMFCTLSYLIEQCMKSECVKGELFMYIWLQLLFSSFSFGMWSFIVSINSLQNINETAHKKDDTIGIVCLGLSAITLLTSCFVYKPILYIDSNYRYMLEEMEILSNQVQNIRTATIETERGLANGNQTVIIDEGSGSLDRVNSLIPKYIKRVSTGFYKKSSLKDLLLGLLKKNEQEKRTDSRSQYIKSEIKSKHIQKVLKLSQESTIIKQKKKRIDLEIEPHQIEVETPYPLSRVGNRLSSPTLLPEVISRLKHERRRCYSASNIEEIKKEEFDDPNSKFCKSE